MISTNEYTYYIWKAGVQNACMFYIWQNVCVENNIMRSQKFSRKCHVMRCRGTITEKMNLFISFAALKSLNAKRKMRATSSKNIKMQRIRAEMSMIWGTMSTPRTLEEFILFVLSPYARDREMTPRARRESTVSAEHHHRLSVVTSVQDQKCPSKNTTHHEENGYVENEYMCTKWDREIYRYRSILLMSFMRERGESIKRYHTYFSVRTHYHAQKCATLSIWYAEKACTEVKNAQKNTNIQKERDDVWNIWKDGGDQTWETPMRNMRVVLCKTNENMLQLICFVDHAKPHLRKMPKEWCRHDREYR